MSPILTSSIKIRRIATTPGPGFYIKPTPPPTPLPDVIITVGDYVFNVTQRTIIDYIGTSTNISIPSTLSSIPVLHLGNYAFAGKSLNTVVVPDGVLSLNDASFYFNPLSSITLSNTITGINTNTFNSTLLTNVTIPSSVTYLEDYVFANTSSLSGVYFDGNAPTNVDVNIFAVSTPTVYRTHAATGFPFVPTSWNGRPTAYSDWLATDYVVTARNTSIPRLYRGVASSSDGSIIIAGVDTYGQQEKSTNSGVSWSSVIPYSTGNRGVAMSSNGSVIAIPQLVNPIYVSTDSGSTFATRAGGYNWEDIACSADGTKMIAGVAGGGSGFLHISTDSGFTWVPKMTDSNRQWTGVACSADGTKMVACDSTFGYIYTSTDTGNTWIQRAFQAPWWKVCSSANGTRLAICQTGGSNLYVSTNSGVTWNVTVPGLVSGRTWRDIACSADGKIIILSSTGQPLYVSVNYGANFSNVGSSKNWEGVTSSADGRKIVAVVNNEYIYTVTVP